METNPSPDCWECEVVLIMRVTFKNVHEVSQVHVYAPCVFVVLIKVRKGTGSIEPKVTEG